MMTWRVRTRRFHRYDIVTVGFLEVRPRDPLFWLDRGVDVAFVCDIGVNLHLSFYDATRETWCYDLATIRWRYASSWLLLDLVSCVLPFDLRRATPHNARRVCLAVPMTSL